MIHESWFLELENITTLDRIPFTLIGWHEKRLFRVYDRICTSGSFHNFRFRPWTIKFKTFVNCIKMKVIETINITTNDAVPSFELVLNPTHSYRTLCGDCLKTGFKSSDFSLEFIIIHTVWIMLKIALCLSLAYAVYEKTQAPYWIVGLTTLDDDTFGLEVPRLEVPHDIYRPSFKILPIIRCWWFSFDIWGVEWGIGTGTILRTCMIDWLVKVLSIVRRCPSVRWSPRICPWIRRT